MAHIFPNSWRQLLFWMSQLEEASSAKHEMSTFDVYHYHD